MKTQKTTERQNSMKTPAYLALLTAILLTAGQTVALAKDKDDADKPGKEKDEAGKAVKHGNAEAGKEKKAEKKEVVKEKKADAKVKNEATKEKKADAKEKNEAGKEKKAEPKEPRAERVNERTETRQGHQAKRIDEGIKKGYLTPAEITKLSSQQKSIESLQKAMNADGKVTKDEAKQLHQQLDEASLNIFAEKHDADGITKPVYRLGKNILLKNDIAQKLGDENLPRQDARAFLGDLHKMLDLKKTLATGNLSEAQRAADQALYNDLLNKYFETK